MNPLILVFLFVAMNLLQTNAYAQTATPTAAEALDFMNKAEAQLSELSIKVSRATWVQENFITDDTQAIAADAIDQITAATCQLVEQSKRFDGLNLSPELARKFMLLKLSLTAPAPKNPALRREMTQIGVSLDGDYGKGKYCRKNGECLDITAIEKIMSTSRNPEELKEVWTGWHSIAPPMRQRYTRFVDLSNQGARETGFKDIGALWRSGYDMPPDEFSADLERLWNQVKPLYLALHTFVRWKLEEKYGPNVVPPAGPIPARLLGNPWAQQWGNIFDLLDVQEDRGGVDVTELLKKKNLDAKAMVKYGEGFFTSMGFAPLPETFWERSLFTKPADREVVCHASAWDLDNMDDLRIKMCIQIRGTDFVTIHHELGHNFYQRAYKDQPFLFKNGANDGFHEAIGDAIALAITPEYLHKVGLLENVPQGRQRHPRTFKASARPSRLPPIRIDDRSVALESILRRNYSPELQQVMVGSAPEVSRSRPSRCTH
jgi:peptidyl-dipeptidase A